MIRWRELQGTLPWWLLASLALVAGAWLRVDQLGVQFLVDDEWHAVRMLLGNGYGDIATHFGLADHSIPLTLAYRWLYLHDALDEWTMHLPLLAAGMLLLVAPLACRSWPLPTRALWLALLATSPVLVYYSRTARPYALLALLGVLGFLAFRRWQQGRGRRWAWVYALATILAGWAHILSLAFLLWPFVHYGAKALAAWWAEPRGVDGRQRLRGLVALALPLALVLAVLLLPPLLVDWRVLAEKAATDLPQPESLLATLLMQFGLAMPALVVPMGFLGLLGLREWWRRDRDFVLLVAGAALAGTLAIVLLRPAWIHHAPVLVRYAAPILPFMLLFTAEGLARALVWAVAQPWARALAGAAAVGALVALGPLPQWYRQPNQFVEHAAFQFDYRPAENPYRTLLELGPVSPFYAELAKQPPGSLTLLEGPGRLISNYMPDPWLQALHHQHVKRVLLAPICGDGGADEVPYPQAGSVHFRQLVRLEDVLARRSGGADYLVLRLQPWTLPRKDFPWPVEWPDMAACAAAVEARLGAPAWRDEQIVVFSLKQVVQALPTP